MNSENLSDFSKPVLNPISPRIYFENAIMTGEQGEQDIQNKKRKSEQALDVAQFHRFSLLYVSHR